MLRPEFCEFGTSTTGTGTLTLAHVTGSPDPVQIYGTSGVHLMPYKLVEFTDNTFTVVKQCEAGYGTLTLAGAITSATLARTTPTVTWVDGTNTYASGSPSAITIGTAANVKVFFGPGAIDIVQHCPYFEDNAGATDQWGSGPLVTGAGQNTTGSSLVSGTEWFFPFIWTVPMLVKKGSMRLTANYTSGTTNLYMRIYEPNALGRPGRLLIDLGFMGTLNAGLNTGGNISTAVHGTGFFLTPGEYVLSVLPIVSGTVGGPASLRANPTGNVIPARFGVAFGTPFCAAQASSGNATAPDPANNTSYVPTASGILIPYFWLRNA